MNISDCKRDVDEFRGSSYAQYKPDERVAHFSFNRR